MSAQLPAPPNQRGCRPAVRRHRSVVDVRAKRYDHMRPRTPPRSTEASLRDRTSRFDTAIYRRRRRVVGLVVAIAVIMLTLGVQAALTDPGSGPASAAGIGTATAPRSVRAQPGDSLWSIAEANHGSVDLTRYLDKLIDLNGGTGIEAGQLVQLP